LDNKNFNLKTTGHILLQFYVLIVLVSSLRVIKMGKLTLTFDLMS